MHQRWNHCLQVSFRGGHGKVNIPLNSNLNVTGKGLFQKDHAFVFSPIRQFSVTLKFYPSSKDLTKSLYYRPNLLNGFLASFNTTHSCNQNCSLYQNNKTKTFMTFSGKMNVNDHKREGNTISEKERNPLASFSSTFLKEKQEEMAAKEERNKDSQVHERINFREELRSMLDKEEEDDEDATTLRDGLAVKAATSSFGGRRRFYKHTSIRKVNTRFGSHWEVLLDGYPMKTPRTEKPYRIPTEGLALAIAYEWDQQVTYKGIEPTYMPITGIATLALDEMVFSKEQTIERCLRYLQSDTITFIFPDDESDRALLRKQQRSWEPILKWMKTEFDVDIQKPVDFLSVAENTPETIGKIRRILEAMDPFTLSACLSMTLDLKSLCTAIAVTYRFISAKDAVEASLLEENHQRGAWGSVELYHELDDKIIYSQVTGASTYLWLLHPTNETIIEMKEEAKRKIAKDKQRTSRVQ